MSEALWGVVIGGIIGSVTPLATLYLGERKWKRDAKLEFMKSERKRREEFYETTLTVLGVAISENSFPVKMIADMYIMMPSEVKRLYDEFMHLPSRTDQDSREALLNIATEMRKDLAARDAEILALFD